MNLVVGVGGRNIAYMPDDEAARFVAGDPTLRAVSEADPLYIKPSELKVGLIRQDG